MNTKPPPPKRVAPHTVAPTTRLLRDSMLHGHQDLYGAIDDEELDDAHVNSNGSVHNSHLSIHNYEAENSKQHATTRVPFLHRQWGKVERAASQLPAIALVTLFHLMVGIPFGVSYFPVGWRSSSAAAAAIAA